MHCIRSSRKSQPEAAQPARNAHRFCKNSAWREIILARSPRLVYNIKAVRLDASVSGDAAQIAAGNRL